MKVAIGLAAGVTVIFVALALTSSHNKGIDLLDTKLTVAPAPVTKLSTVNGKTVLSTSLWKEVADSLSLVQLISINVTVILRAKVIPNFLAPTTQECSWSRQQRCFALNVVV